MNGDSCALTKRGREAASDLARCHFDVEVTREFDRRTECERLAESNGLRKLGQGAKRTIYALADPLVDGDRECVLKVAHSLNGYYENRSEVTWWGEMPDDVRQFFAPVVDHGRGWVLMPRAETDVTKGDLRELVADLEARGWTGEDAKLENVGLIDGRPILLDYGKGNFEDE